MERLAVTDGCRAAIVRKLMALFSSERKRTANYPFIQGAG